MKNRIMQLMQSLHMNQQAFAATTHISPATLSNIFSEKTRPTLAHVEAITKYFPQVSMQWLVAGIGDMYNEMPADQASSSSPAPQQQDLFSDSYQQSSGTDKMSVNERQQIPSQQHNPTSRTPQFSAPVQTVQPVVQQRKITEIRVFYDDQTWESFVPKK